MSDNQLRSPASVDVAIPCYQHGGFLRDCVASVLIQAMIFAVVMGIVGGFLPARHAAKQVIATALRKA